VDEVSINISGITRCMAKLEMALAVLMVVKAEIEKEVNSLEVE
jgi:hypothetical protein